MRYAKNESGVTLIQVMIAVALLSTVALGIASLTTQTSFLTQHLQNQNGRIAVSMVVQSVLRQDPLCDSMINVGSPITLPTGSAPGVSPLRLTLRDDATPANQTVIESGQKLAKFGVDIAAGGFTYTIPAATTGVPAGAGQSIWTGVVDLRLDGGSNIALQRRTVGILQLRVDSSNNIVSCEGFTATSADTCAALGGTWSGTSCAFPYIYPCPSGSILTGPNPPADCRSCPANQVLVFAGAGGFSCLPYP